MKLAKVEDRIRPLNSTLHDCDQCRSNFASVKHQLDGRIIYLCSGCFAVQKEKGERTT